MPKIRQNIITGEWVVIAPERSKRPQDFVSEKKEKENPSDCPFCSTGAGLKDVITRCSTENVLVIPNKYPSFVDQKDRLIVESNGFYYSSPSVGKHEVIILKDHKKDLQDLPERVLVELISVYQNRIQEHYEDPVIDYTLIIHNHGRDAGASIEHPHSQILSSAVVPAYVEKEIQGSLKYFVEHGKCIYCDIVHNELTSKARLVYENHQFAVFTFFAARFPFETWIVPKFHSANFEEMDQSQRESLADALNDILKKMDSRLNDPDYNFFIHTSPNHRQNIDKYYHWHLEICPRLIKYGGYELGGGTVIDVVSPESAVRFLKD